MGFIDSDAPNLREQRETAKLSQTDLGRLLGLTQSQVSRYEGAPDEVPYKVVVSWKAACGDIIARKGLDIEDPYSAITGNIEFLKQYVERVGAPDLSGLDAFECPSVDTILQQLEFLNRKPRIAFYGKFDAGKSRIANTLLGVEGLPTGYTPTTRLACVISLKDSRGRPAFIKEPVWIMDDRFRLKELMAIENDQKVKDYWQDRRIISGAFDTLRLYGSHNETTPADAGAAKTAMVYINAPILRACDLIDLPGYGNDEQDTQRADITDYMADAVIFVAPVTGFLNAQDIPYLLSIIDNLPVLDQYPGTPPLANLFIIASHANPNISDDDLQKVLDHGSKRLFEIVDRRFKDAYPSRQPLTLAGLRDRMFSFYVESPDRRALFEEDLRRFLQEIYPSAIGYECDEAVRNFKRASHSFTSGWAARLEGTIQRANRARNIVELLDRSDMQIKARAQAKLTEVKKEIAKLRESSYEDTLLLEKKYDQSRIESIIRKNYPDRKQAQTYCASFVVSSIDTDAAEIIHERSGALPPLVDQFLAVFSVGSVSHKEGTNLANAFDARVAFIESIARINGTAEIGALRIWVQQAKEQLIVEVLSPTALKVISAVAAGVSATVVANTAGLIGGLLAGPLIMGAVIFISIALAAFSLSGFWQERLARKIRITLEDRKLIPGLAERSNSYWQSTSTSFRLAADATLERYDRYRDSLRGMLTESHDTVRDRIARLRDAKVYFDNLPWQDEGREAR
jgi:hypothetical protein